MTSRTAPHHSTNLAPALLFTAVLAACGGGNDDTSTTAPVPATATTAAVQCDYAHDAFNANALVNLNSTVQWSCDTTRRTMTANSVPDHDVGPFDIQEAALNFAISEQNTVITMPIAPAVVNSTGVASFTAGYALNGLKFDPGTGGSCPDTATSNDTTVVSGDTTVGGCSLLGNVGNWRMEALGQSSFNFGVDDSNGHVQPTGEYHYHGMPEKFIEKLGKGNGAMTLIGWAYDGFPMYARYGYVNATDASSGLKVITSSYRTKATPDAGRPATTIFPMGTFLQDYEYVAGSGDLDECNGRVGVTPEFPSGVYHYMVTDGWPFVHRCMKGTSAEPPRGGPPG